MDDANMQRDLLALAGRLLLEHNESTKAIEDALTTTAIALTGESCAIATSYRTIAVSLKGEPPALESIHELRYNNALQLRVYEILSALRRGETDVTAALGHLRKVGAETPRHSRWIAAALLGIGALCLAMLLGADSGAAITAGIASALGLVARQELGRRHYSLLTLPFTAAFIGALIGGIVIRLGGTTTPELVLIVPALMLVPGPHIINALLDLIDNYVPMAVARLGLAAGILLAAATGIYFGARLTLPQGMVIEAAASADLNVVSIAILAAITTMGFAMFYNSPWRFIWMAALGGMAGNALRFLVLEAGMPPEMAALFGGLTVGLVAGWISRRHKMPLAVLAFAGAVTMIPGLHIYRALAGAVRIARQGETTDPAFIAQTLSYGAQSCLVVFGLTLGLVLGGRIVLALPVGRTN